MDDHTKELRENVRPIFNIFREWLNANLVIESNWAVLEIGVGPNGFPPFYAEMFRSYVGLDVDDYRKNYADIINARVLMYDGLTMPLPDASIDLIVSHSCFEHISDVSRVLDESDRVLRRGGHIYITINPLYYSSWGSHGTLPDHATRLAPWEHLNPASPIYLTDCPPQMMQAGYKGCFLNKLTASQLLGEVGRRPWSIMKFDRAYEAIPVPDFARSSGIPMGDILNHDIRLLARKDW